MVTVTPEHEHDLQRRALEKLQDEMRVWFDKNFPDAPPHQSLLGIAEEVGELSHAHLKAEQGIRGTPEEHHAAKVDAIGDLNIFMVHYCLRNGIDYAAAFIDTWHKVRDRKMGEGVWKPTVQCATDA